MQKYKCGCCDNVVTKDMRFCDRCGRELDWEAMPAQHHKNWFKVHINLTYLFCLLVGLWFLIPIGIIQGYVAGYIAWLVILLVSTGWVLWQKGRSFGYLTLVVLIAIIGIPVVFCLENQKNN